MRPRVDVDAVGRGGQRQRPGVGLGDHRVAEEGRLGHAGRELRGELAVAAVRAAPPDQADGRGVPERRRPAVAQDHLVAVGQVEQLGQALAHLAHQALDRRLPVGGPHEGGAAGGQRLEGLGAHLRRAAAEAAVGGQEVGGDGDAHLATFRGRPRCRVPPRASEWWGQRVLLQAGWSTALTVIVSKPSTSSGLRGAGPT